MTCAQAASTARYACALFSFRSYTRALGGTESALPRSASLLPLPATPLHLRSPVVNELADFCSFFLPGDVEMRLCTLEAVKGMHGQG